MRSLSLIAIVAILGSALPAAAAAPWASPAYAMPQDKNSCSANGFGADFALGLFVDRQRSEVVTLSIMPSYGGLPLSKLGPAELTVTFSDRVLKLAGQVDAGQSDKGHGTFSGAIPAGETPEWLHELTASTTATLTVTGQAGPPQPVALLGSSAAIDKMEKCIAANAFAGVPLPFKSPSNAPAPHVSGCLTYGDRPTLDGKLLKRMKDVIEGPQPFPEIALPQPVCVYRSGINPFKADIRAIQLIAAGDQQYDPPARAYGRAITVTGTLRPPVSRYEIEPVVMDVNPADVKLH